MANCVRCDSVLGTYEFNHSAEGVICDNCVGDGSSEINSSEIVGSAGDEGMNRNVMIGIMMIVGALIWFFAGLVAGTIFFYPPILLVLGIVRIARSK